MSWFNVWTGIKNKTCRYLLERYLGQFLEGSINLQQLKVDLYNGKATIKNVSLNVNAFNKLFEDQGWSLEIISGHIGLLTVTVPWNALMSNNSYIEVEDAFIVVRPVQRQNTGASMLESMWSSASSSMQLAEECMKQKDDDFDDNTTTEIDNKSLTGLEKFAETIDNILNRIKATFTNTTLCLEYHAANGTNAISLCIDINKLLYENETGCERLSKDAVQQQQQQYSAYNTNRTASLPGSVEPPGHAEDENIYLLPMFAKHNISIRGLRIYTEELKVCGEEHLDNTNNGAGATIPILEINEHLNMRIKMKQAESINGPKVVIDTEMGAIYMLLTPRQIHLLVKLMDAFQDEPYEQHDTNLDAGSYCGDAPSEHGGVIYARRGDDIVELGNWMDCDTLHNTNTSSKRDNTLQQHIRTAGLRDITRGGYSPPSSSMSSSTTLTGYSRWQRRPTTNLDYTGEILKFSLKICSFVAVVLMEDILVESSNNAQSPLNKSSEEAMINFADKFFECTHQIHDNQVDTRKLTEGKNHIYIRIATIISEGSQHRIKHLILSNINFIAQRLELFEVLSGKITELITFERPDGLNTADLSINIKSEANAKTLDILLQKCQIEFDISIYDRLSAIWCSSPFDTFSTPLQTPCYYLKSEATATTKCTVTINVTAQSLELKLRFPIYDARPIHDPQRVPWWQQNIRADYILLTLEYLNMKIDAGGLELLSNELNVHYVAENEEQKIWLLKTSSKIAARTSKTNKLDFLKITITIPDDCYWTKLKRSSLDALLYGNSSSANKTKAQATDRLPFSAKYVCRESDTLHNKHDATESETILLPGETAELAEFCANTMLSAKIQVQMHVPSIEIFLESKQFYEIIYNRFNTDIFMWEPSSPILSTNNAQSTSENKQSIRNITTATAAHIIHKQINERTAASDDSDDADSDTTSSRTKINLNNISMTESIYFSLHETAPVTAEECDREEPALQKSAFAIEIVIENGTLGLCVPVRNKDNKALTDGIGKIDFMFNDLKIFSVNGYNDNKDLCYLCLQLSDFQMQHCGLYTAGASAGSKMLHTLYKTPQGLTKSNQTKIKEREMFSMVIETKRVPDQRIKRLRLSTGVQQTTLRYYTMLGNQFWLHQLIDFFDVLYYPIDGYVPFGVVIEMQLHLWNCAIDYRPKNFEYRALIELGAFTTSTNVISAAAGCNLRFIIEDFILSLAPYEETKLQHKLLIDSKQLVPVLDIGFFDISLRLNEHARDKYPKFDLRCSMHDAHLRTCCDSAKALAQLIEHLANDGDGVEADTATATAQTSITTQSSECSSGVGGDNASVDSSTRLSDEELQRRLRRESATQQQLELKQERVNLMMAEALCDTVTISKIPTTSKHTAFSTVYGIEPYYFPDEQQTSESEVDLEEQMEFAEIKNFEQHVMLQSYTAIVPVEDDVLPQVKSDLGDVNIPEVKYQTQQRKPRVHEEGYCVITEDELQLIKQCGIKNLKLTEDPICIVDNHFSLPTNRVDLLKAPDDFPTPVSRYTLCEMTITWHLYGGHDFPHTTNTEDVTSKKELSHLRMSDAYRHGVSYSKGDTTVHAIKKPRDISWKSLGGEQRNHEVIVEIQLTKARLSHEIYPSYTTQASRQVLVINDIEIRDRLQSSEINKFLYHPRAQQTHKSPQQMLVIKALHIRPQPKLSASEECSLRISLLPLRLHIDQDTLVFLADFFTNIGDNTKEPQTSAITVNNPPTPTHEPQAPILAVEGVDTISNLDDELQARELISTNLDLLENEVINKEALDEVVETKQKSAPIYFREVSFSPDVPIRFDYHGHRVELSRGPIAGLLMGLGQLQCSEIRLKKIVHRRGVLGIEKLVTYLCKEWLNDIKRNQLPRILKGVGPTYSFVQFVQGVIDLFRLPIEQYQRDGRIIRGLQLGAQSFTAGTALAALEITARVIQLLQFTAETAFDLVSSGPSIATVRRKHRKDKKRRTHRPQDMREGVTNAYLIVKEGINDSAATLIETAVAEHDQKGYTGAVGAVMRQIPQLVVCPAVLATQATTNILGGVKSSLVPEAMVEAREKWKTEND
ncbi:autophagy-related protein 2 homolog B [Eurosta solidaginis]|uniref:autophagy-related protein 2 homolog B n=1 Tax=Eurosta solidaginis TaxID=178769 RepID=UPI003530EC11